MNFQGALCKADRRSSFNEAWTSFQICPSLAKNAIQNVLSNILTGQSYMNLFPTGSEHRREKWDRLVKENELVVRSKRSPVGWIPASKLCNQEKFLNRMLLNWKDQTTLMDFFKAGVDRGAESLPTGACDGVKGAVVFLFCFVLIVSVHL